jgi:thioredoxin 1
MVKIIKDADFKTEVLESNVVTIVDFYADWCGPCKQIAPLLEAIQNNLGDKIKIVKINVDENQEYGSKFGVRSIPTLIAFKDGEKIDTKIGSLTKVTLDAWVNSLTN